MSICDHGFDPQLCQQCQTLTGLIPRLGRMLCPSCGRPAGGKSACHRRWHPIIVGEAWISGPVRRTAVA